MADDEVTSGPSAVKVDVWNRALNRIGQTEWIEDEGADQLAAVGHAVRPPRGEALELRDWDFARKQCQLRVAPVGAARAGWNHVYSLPEDFVSARALLQGGLRASLDPEETRLAYELQANDAGDGLLLCTDADLSDVDALEYTSSAVTITVWPRLFVSAVVWRLAAELALAIVKGAEGQRLANAALQMFEAAVAVTHARRARSAQPDQDLEAPSIRARG